MVPWVDPWLISPDPTLWERVSSSSVSIVLYITSQLASFKIPETVVCTAIVRATDESITILEEASMAG